MKTAKSIQEAINEIRRNRAEYIEVIDRSNWTFPEKETAKHQKTICETRISDLTIALELAKEKEEAEQILYSLLALKDIIEYKEPVKSEHQGEAFAIKELMNRAEHHLKLI